MRQRFLVIDHRAEIMAGLVPEFVGGLFCRAGVKANAVRPRSLQFGRSVCQAQPHSPWLCGSHDKTKGGNGSDQMDFGGRDGDARYSREQHQRERESVHRCGPLQQTGRWNRSGRLSWQPAPYWKLLKIPTAPFAGRARAMQRPARNAAGKSRQSNIAW